MADNSKKTLSIDKLWMLHDELMAGVRIFKPETHYLASLVKREILRREGAKNAFDGVNKAKRKNLSKDPKKVKARRWQRERRRKIAEAKRRASQTTR